MFELKEVDDRGKFQLMPQHRTTTTVASLARSWTSTRPPDVRHYEGRAKLCGFALAWLGQRDSRRWDGKLGVAHFLIERGRQRDGDGSTCAYESGTMTCDCSALTRKTTAAQHSAPQRLTLVRGVSSLVTHLAQM